MQPTRRSARLIRDVGPDMRDVGRILIGIVLAVATVDASAAEGHNSPVISAIREAFQKKTPSVETVYVLDSREWHGSRWVLARGIRKDQSFQGNFDEELFGVFLFKGSTLIETLDLFRTERWNDYRVSITTLTDTALRLKGAGDMYGDSPMHKTYDISRFVPSRKQ